MKLEIPDNISLLDLHPFAQEQGCRIYQTDHGDMVMKKVVVKFPVRPSRCLTNKQCREIHTDIEHAPRSNQNPDGPSSA